MFCNYVIALLCTVTGNDCGVFTCMFANFLANKMEMTFTQEHISRCRNLMALSILQGESGKPILSGYKLQLMELTSRISNHWNSIVVKNKTRSEKSKNEKLVLDVKNIFDIIGWFCVWSFQQTQYLTESLFCCPCNNNNLIVFFVSHH